MRRAAHDSVRFMVAYITRGILAAIPVMRTSISDAEARNQQPLCPRRAMVSANVIRFAPVQHIWLFATKYRNAASFAASFG